MKFLRKPALLLALLVVAVAIGFNGSSLSPIAMGEDSAEQDVAQVVPTVALTPSPEAEPTPTPASPAEAPATVPPAQVPIEPPVPTETPAPQETPRPQVPENAAGSSIVIERGPSGREEVALTFDAGEGAGYTDEILDFLAENNLKASFGVTGDWARAYPELVERIVDEGHQLFNHSESHRSWTGVSTGAPPLTEDERIDELAGPDRVVEEIVDYEMAPFWRPPYGDYDAEGQELLAEYGYDYTFYWSCDTLAWTGTTPQEIAEKCGPDGPGGGPGAIILMHVAQEADYRSLELLVPAYEAQGYEFVTMEEMLAE